MAANSPKKTTSPLPIIAILAILGGAYYASSQLKSSRPEAPVGLTHAISEKGKIDARLWQDPLKVACEHEKTLHGKGNNYAFEISPIPLVTDERPIYINQISDYESKVNQISKNESNANQTSKDKSNGKESSTEHSISQVTERIRLIDKTWREDVNTPVHILLTMIRDDISGEDHERRLRNRYAMATALYSSGFVPEDPMHIQYFRLPWIDKNELEKVDPQNDLEKYRHIPKIEDPNYTSDYISEPLIVPYEWFEQEKVYLSQTANRGADDRPKHVLLVWLPESAFSHWPMTRLAQVIEVLGHDPNSIDLIGPSRSGTLRTMLSEIIDLLGPNKTLDEKLNDIEEMIKDIDPKPTVNTNIEKLAELKKCKQRLEKLKVLNGVTIFSPWSTTSPALLAKKWPYDANDNSTSGSEMDEVISTDANDNSIWDMYKVIPQDFNDVKIKFIRMIGSDDLLALELINELKRRGVDILPKYKGGKEHHVALISEWDTFYGNAFPLTFATMMEKIDSAFDEPNNWSVYARDLNQREHASSFPVNLHTYSYIRGVDGKLPESQSSKEEKTNDNSKLVYTTGLESPVGRSQLDYVRRLTQKLSNKFEHFGNNELKAIGVVGSDVYDKLVLLHALREQFNDILIFTIDIDARMWHHEQTKWTRNVIVASNYGLELSDSYQKKIFLHRADRLSPFRDNYQTSLFLACRTALTPCQDNDILYRDMSRKKLIQIISHPQLFEIGRGRAVNLTVSREEDVLGIHPPRPDWKDFKKDFIKNRGFILLVIGILILIYFILKIGLGLGKIVLLKDIKELTFFDIIAQILGLVVILSIIILFVVIVIYDHYREAGEPFSLDAGVSIWPGVILRLIAVICGVSLLFRLVNKLKESEHSLADKFFEKPKSETKDQSTALQQLMEGSDWVLFSLGFGRRSKDEEKVIAQNLWKKYLSKSNWIRRFLRVLPIALAYMILAFIILYIFGQPNTPYRGEVSLNVNRYILLLSGIYMIILTFFVVDATHLCLKRLTEPLIKLHTEWPDKAKEDFEEGPDIKEKDLAELLDVKFVTQLTEDIGKMIYWPFIVLAVMVASRFPYFDNWNFPISLTISYSIPAICLLICAVALQRTAKKVRAKALDYLNKQRFAAKLGKDENRKRALKLTYMIKEIESIREGAFRPCYENPVIHVILGSGGAGLLALLKYLPLS